MTREKMSWEQLLDDTRIRKALEGPDSIKAQDESRSEFERDRDRTVYSIQSVALSARPKCSP